MFFHGNAHTCSSWRPRQAENAVLQGVFQQVNVHKRTDTQHTHAHTHAQTCVLFHALLALPSPLGSDVGADLRFAAGLSALHTYSSRMEAPFAHEMERMIPYGTILSL